MIKPQSTQARWERCLIVLTFLCVAAYLSLFAVMNFYGFSQFCDSDIYCDTVVSKMIWEQKHFSTKAGRSATSIMWLPPLFGLHYFTGSPEMSI